MDTWTLGALKTYFSLLIFQPLFYYDYVDHDP